MMNAVVLMTEKTCVFMTILLSIISSAFSINCIGSRPLIDIVPDDDFSASLDSDDRHPLSDAKLSSNDAWCSVEIPDVNTAPFIQVDFDSTVEINSVSVGGHTDGIVFQSDEYIVNYNIVYRPPGGEEQFVTDDDGNPRVFARKGNVDVQTVVLNTSIITDILQIRALPGSWISDNNRLCIRFEASGCLASFLESDTSSLYLSTSSTIIVASSITSSPSLVMQQSLSTGIVTTTSNDNSLYMSKSSSYSSSVDASSHSNSNSDSSSSSSSSSSSGSSSSSNSITESNIGRPVVNGSSGKGNEAAIYGSSAAAGILIIVVIIVIIVFLMFIALRRKSQKKESSHELDNCLYEYSMDDITNSESDLKAQGLGLADINSRYVYESVGHLTMGEKNNSKAAIVEESKFGMSPAESNLAYERNMNNVIVSGAGPKEGEVGGDGKGSRMYETVEDSTAKEKYDYAQTSDGTDTLCPAHINKESISRLHLDQDSDGFNDITMSPNPTYNDTKHHMLVGGGSDATVGLSPPPSPLAAAVVPNNPLYGSGSAGHCDSPVVLPENDDDMVLNPLYNDKDSIPV